MGVSIMKISKSIFIIFILMIVVFSLTACKNDIAYINDQTGKEISVTTSDNTYTFQLPSISVQETESSTKMSEPSTTIVESEVSTTAEESETTEKNPPTFLESEGPKTGEP